MEGRRKKGPLSVALDRLKSNSQMKETGHIYLFAISMP